MQMFVGIVYDYNVQQLQTLDMNPPYPSQVAEESATNPEYKGIIRKHEKIGMRPPK